MSARVLARRYTERDGLNAVTAPGCPKLPSYMSRWESALLRRLTAEKNSSMLEGAGV